jgi:hypothetical protein
MASISIGLLYGIDQAKISDVVVGTASPSGSTDVEIRWNSTDTNSVVRNRKDVILAARALIQALESGNLQTPIGTPWLGSPIL